MTPPARITVTLFLERDDNASILVRKPEAETAPVWLPLRQIEIAPERHGRLIMVTMPLWLAEEKGFAVKPDPNQGRLF